MCVRARVFLILNFSVLPANQFQKLAVHLAVKNTPAAAVNLVPTHGSNIANDQQLH